MKKIEVNKVKNILKINGVNLEKKHIKNNNILYKTNEYLSMASSFNVFDSENIRLKNNKIKLRKDLIYYLFLMNVFKFSKLGLILPCVVFLLISLISFTLGFFWQNKGNFGFEYFNDNQLQFLFFIAIFMLFIFIIYLYLIVIRKEVVFYTKKNGQNRLVHLSKNEFIKMCKIFEENIKKDSEKFEFLESNRLIIRTFNQNDKNDVYEFLKNDNFVRFLNMKKAKDMNDAIEFIQKNLDFYEENLFYKLAIEKKDSNTVIGFIGLSKNDLSRETCQVIYGINEPYWNQGFTSEALKVYLEYLESNGMKYIFSGHIKENVNSGKVLLKNNFKRYEKKDCVMNIKGEKKDIVSYIYLSEGAKNEDLL